MSKRRTGRTRAIIAGITAAMLLAGISPPEAKGEEKAAARIDAPADEVGKDRVVRGAAAWVGRFVAMSRGLRGVQVALIDGAAGLIVAPGGKVARVMVFTVADDKVARVEVLADPARLRDLEIAVL